VAATYGRKFAQDDSVWTTSHGALLGDFDFTLDGGRLEAPVPASLQYGIKRDEYIKRAWVELLAMYRTVRQLDSVKLIVIDLDDTLWRGVAVEQSDLNSDAVEGWPGGFAEALTHLKRRGVLLAVMSKNDPSLVVPVIDRLYRNRLELSDFVVVKINWRPKVENFEEILREVNLLPHNVVYIDDNPVERAAIQAAFPDVRTFGPNPLVWRRLLLWSSETQVQAVTAESSARTAMVQAQVEREQSRKKMSRKEFLESLKVEMTLREVDHPDHPDFARLFELLNKSNQFNTTGGRWAKQEIGRAMAEGVSFFVFEVRDRFTAYGIVGIMIFDRSSIIQFVMSCRVVGMEVEIAAVAELLRVMRRRAADNGATGILEETDLNLLARDLWERCGFIQTEGSWVRPYEPELKPPSHIHVSVEQREAVDAL
jgi:FkbH-like protein